MTLLCVRRSTFRGGRTRRSPDSGDGLSPSWQ
jgi:hypothetical protein